tara:strand:- start:53 stop:541 length:489 start_codon:yes stop_codon:yes gene_type:complete
MKLIMENWKKFLIERNVELDSGKIPMLLELVVYMPNGLSKVLNVKFYMKDTRDVNTSHFADQLKTVLDPKQGAIIANMKMPELPSGQSKSKGKRLSGDTLVLATSSVKAAVSRVAAGVYGAASVLKRLKEIGSTFGSLRSLSDLAEKMNAPVIEVKYLGVGK